MSWLAVSLTVDSTYAERLAEALLNAGAASVETTDAFAGTRREQPLFAQPDAAYAPVWERVQVCALFAAGADVDARLAAALAAAQLDCAHEYSVATIAERDWVRATQSQFPPVRISDRLWVVPSWHAPPNPAAINLIIDPGLAFGTGTHASTRLCLAWLDECLRGGEAVIDYGCGSGILAIAAMKLGAGSARGVDIDTDALLAARRNAMQNEVTVRFEAPDHPLVQPADIVLANILASPLLLLAPLLARATRTGGRIVLSGILESQAAEVGDAYAPWFSMEATRHDDGWTLLAGHRY